MDSPEGSHVKIIVVRSGPSDQDEWKSEKRNVYEDYVDAFGSEPKRRVGAIAIMCDADSTGSVAESKFDEITIASQI